MGIIFEKYRNGINLGGWISQCTYEKAHIAEFITESDIIEIASWGLDHIRLPVDYPVLEDDITPIDRALEWCKSAGLNLVLDMHKAPGYSFNAHAASTFFTDEAAQNRFVELWQIITRRYANEGDNLIFDLLNEVVDAHGDAWNKIARRGIEAIHAISPERYVLLGGEHYNSSAGLHKLEIYDNPYVLYNFHFYEPMYVTHQRARWTHLRDTNITQPYPGFVQGVETLRPIFETLQFPKVTEDTMFDIDYLEKCLAPAIEFAQKHGKELYCGEYGCIGLAGTDARANYTKDVNVLFDKYKMGRALWSYKKMDFNTVGEDALIAALK
ncbi:MAG: glycoside hydrolase family 5 protein [Defluviitaleaceae bacterium]|nr:glycoside hydrolase family 5 protein [Defluviitaleaceae bacterium]